MLARFATLTLPEAAFDVMLGLDGMRGVTFPQRARLLHQCATLLRPLGRIAFYDHVVCQPMPAEAYQHFCRLWRFPGLETPQSYREALQASGFRILVHDVTSGYAVRFYTCLLTLYSERRMEFAAMRGPARYQEGLERLQMSQRLRHCRRPRTACLYRGEAWRARPHAPAPGVASPGTPARTKARKGDGTHRCHVGHGSNIILLSLA